MNLGWRLGFRPICAKYNRTYNQRERLGIFFLSCFVSFLAFSKPASIQEAQNQLKRLDFKMDRLRQSLHSDENKRGLLNQELTHTQRQIKESTQKFQNIQKDLTQKKQGIIRLQLSKDQFNAQLLKQQKGLAEHIRARYRTGPYQPMKWFINQDDPHKISRILNYYQYLIHKQQDLIEQINQTASKIAVNQKLLQEEFAQIEHLNRQLELQQKKLQQNKHYHLALLQTLNQKIQGHQQDLNSFQKDKDQLAALLKSLTLSSRLQSNKPFAQMRKKLPFPIPSPHPSLQKMNQGITFFADEGTTVTAIYPGKVVFSDWLKGYGFLLILDHGQGFMSLYAHNQALFKHKGQMVQQSEQIASVGHSGGLKQNGLYFEIRQRGKAVSPLDWFA